MARVVKHAAVLRINKVRLVSARREGTVGPRLWRTSQLRAGLGEPGLRISA